MTWDFEVVALRIWGGRISEWDEARGLDSSLPPPWEVLEGVLVADTGREYAWEISTLTAFVDPQSWVGDDELPLIHPFTALGRSDLFLSETDIPAVIIDAPSFGRDLLDFLRSSPSELRPQWLYPLPED